jgi:S1-C subfamily serine protease
MRKSQALLLAALLLANGAFGQAARFVIDDDEFLDQVTRGSGRLAREHKLVSSAALREQIRACPRSYPLKAVPQAQEKLSPPDLCERLRQSTLAVGSYYKCKDCPDWHFNASAGFVVGDGVVSTCCHVVAAEDAGVRESFLVAADSTGHVFPVRSVLAADMDADTCFLKIDAAGLKPLPLRPQIRPGERVYCLSHPGGYHFMFTEGMVARLNRQRNAAVDDNGKTNGNLTRPVLFLNVTAEFAPGSSGGPVVDEMGNVVGQVASIADAGEPEPGDEHTPASPSVPVRFCTAAEEILRLTDSTVAETRGSKAATRKKADARHGK